ncbi:MAG: hypothetical protein GY749_14630 [Desulfobacteraceae bacterium]|nr:hypothetical protein [Desulfobacteraceae bacterium]
MLPRHWGRLAVQNLWSEQEKKAGNADIDILEIRSNSNISYDYAINALLITLKNDASRPTEYVKQIPAVIEKNAVIPESVRVKRFCKSFRYD